MFGFFLTYSQSVRAKKRKNKEKKEKRKYLLGLLAMIKCSNRIAAPAVRDVEAPAAPASRVLAGGALRAAAAERSDPTSDLKF